MIDPSQPAFFTVQLYGRSDTKVEPTITLQERPSDYVEPFFDESGKLQIQILSPQGDEHHTALGIFMDRWSHLERDLQTLLEKVTGLDFGKTQIFVNALGMHSLLDALPLLALPKLTQVDHARLTKLLERVRKLNTKRNYLVHGHWMIDALLVVKKGEVRVSSEAVRFYPPADPRDEKGIRNWKNQKLRVKFLFPPKRLQAVTQEVVKLERELTEFMISRGQADPANEGQPIGVQWTQV